MAQQSQSLDALKTWQLANNMSSDLDAIFKYDNNEQQRIMKDKPWARDPNHFKKVRISAVALVKMVMHARSGGSIEVMGLMQGKVVGDTMVVMDAFALPVEGTETRVNAAAEGYEYMVDYVIKGKEVCLVCLFLLWDARSETRSERGWLGLGQIERTKCAISARDDSRFPNQTNTENSYRLAELGMAE
ncbi:COP9 signalosome complex subunit 5 [Podochytrium sp. JEL0797]|nr:COP9 signalosome complex subunit 5 [Podochytrium sp. JEL0797]